MSKKVCILTSVHLVFDGRIFHKQAKTLAKAGYDVTLIAQHKKNEAVNKIKIIALPNSKNRLLRMLKNWNVFKLACKQQADIYHFHDPELIPIGLLLKILRKKVIYDVHEDYGKSILSKHYLPKYFRNVISQLSNLIEKFTSAFFDAIIVAADDILRKFTHHQRVVALKNLPVLPEFTKVEGNLDAPNVFNVIYIGALSEERGIGGIVQAMKYLNPFNNVKLILYGKFSPKQYEEKVRRLSGFEKVEYLGWIEQKNVWSKMMQANAGIVCHRPIQRFTNAVATKLFDYMAAGLPVIASDFPLWKEIIEGNNCGLTVNPLNPREIARAVQYLVEHPDEARKMGKNGRKAVEAKYNWQNEEKKLLAVYKDLLGEQGMHR